MTTFNRLPLLWRVFAINAALLLVGTLVLALAPGRIHASLAVVESLDLAILLVVMLAANLLLLRPTLSPVDRLVERMRTVDLLRPGQRLAEQGGPEVVEVVRVFNQMLDRLETERRESSGRVLAAQEAERRRIASGSENHSFSVISARKRRSPSSGRGSDFGSGLASASGLRRTSATTAGARMGASLDVTISAS